METKLENRQVVQSVIVIVLFSLPMIYLAYKTFHRPDSQREKTVQDPQQDITELEKSVKEDASFENLLNLSAAYLNHRMPEKSIEPLRLAISLNPQSAVAYNNLGVAYISLEQYQEGIDALTKAIQINPTYGKANKNLKMAIGEKMKVLTAIEDQEQTPADKRGALFNLDYGLNYFKIGNYDKSIAIWNNIVARDARNVEALNHIATALMMKSLYEDSMVLYRKVLEIEPENQLAKHNLARVTREKERQAQVNE